MVRFPSYTNCSVALLQLQDPARAKVGARRRWRSLTPMQQSAWERDIDSQSSRILFDGSGIMAFAETALVLLRLLISGTIGLIVLFTNGYVRVPKYTCVAVLLRCAKLVNVNAAISPFSEYIN